MLRRVDHPPDRSQVLRVSHALGCSSYCGTSFGPSPTARDSMPRVNHSRTEALEGINYYSTYPQIMIGSGPGRLCNGRFDFRTVIQTFLVAGSPPSVMRAGAHAPCLHTRTSPTTTTTPTHAKSTHPSCYCHPPDHRVRKAPFVSALA